MNIVDIILKKKDGLELSKEEIDYVITEFLNKEIKDYQMSSLLMAILLKGMNKDEVVNLTNSMLKSGDIIDLSNVNGEVVDKHSTGGVGDKTTLIILPIVASLGVKVAKMSGRGLGHTGGTADKLESIDGININLDTTNFIKQINEINVAITTQTGNIAPADKLIYALRDVTGTVSSIPLIASSVMSKKLGSGADIIVLDVKVGRGALIKTLEEAHELAELMVEIGKSNNKKIVALITDMDNPLGDNIGNSLEVLECIDILKNNKKGNLYELCLILASYMVSLAKNISYEEALREVKTVIDNNSAYNKFLEMIKYQGGDISSLKQSKYIYTVKSNNEGYITSIDALGLGKLSVKLGAGRLTKEDKIDYETGFVILKNVGEYVNKDDKLIEIHTDKEVDIENEVLACFEFGNSVIDKKIVYDIIK